MDDHKKEFLAWVIEFANADLGQLKEGDRAKLVVEVQKYLFPTEKDLPWPLWEKISGKPEVKQKYLRMLNQSLKDAAWFPIMKQSDLSWDQFWEKITPLQAKLKSLFEELASIAQAKKDDRRLFSEPAIFAFEVSDKFSFSSFPIASALDKYCELKIYQFLDGLPSTAIRKCPECQKLFFNATRREKRFCSPQCLWRHNARARRQEDPEKYRKYQREVMRDKYRIEKGLKPKKFYKRS